MANNIDPSVVARAVEEIDRDRLVQLVIDLTNIPSPTGYEGDMARAVHEVFQGTGFDSVLQPIGDERYNTVGRLQGRGGGIDGLRIALIGDLRYGRTVHSLCKLLTLFKGLDVHLISPAELQMPGGIVEDMRRTGHQITQTEELEQHISHVDIAYSTRIQEERFTSRAEADLYRGRFRLNQNIYTQHCEPNTVIMHPLPRDSRADANELDNDLNDNPNLAIFRQTDNGVLVRMALFALVLDVVDQVDREARDVNWHTGSRSQ